GRRKEGKIGGLPARPTCRVPTRSIHPAIHAPVSLRALAHDTRPAWPAAVGAWPMKSAWMWCRVALCAVVVAFFASAARAAEARVIVLAEMDKAPQAETVVALNAELQRNGVGLEVLAPVSANHAALAGASLIVTVGGQAAQTTVALETASPVLHVLLSRSSLDALGHRPGSAPWSAIVLDQPAERQ